MWNVSEGTVVSAGAAAIAAEKEAGEKEADTFSLKGQVIAAIVVTAVAGNILGARRFRYVPARDTFPLSYTSDLAR